MSNLERGNLENLSLDNKLNQLGEAVAESIDGRLQCEELFKGLDSLQIKQGMAVFQDIFETAIADFNYKEQEILDTVTT